MIGDQGITHMLKPRLSPFVISKLLFLNTYILEYKYILFLSQLILLLHDIHYLRVIILANYYSNSPFLIAWEFIATIYKVGWGKLSAENNNQSIQQMVLFHFNKSQKNQHKNPLLSDQRNQSKVSKILPPISPRPNAETLAKSKYIQNKRTFAQAAKKNVKNILKIKEAFPSLLSKKVIEIHNAAFSTNPHSYPRITMTTKGPLHKHILIPISKDNRNMVLVINRQ